MSEKLKVVGVAPPPRAREAKLRVIIPPNLEIMWLHELEFARAHLVYATARVQKEIDRRNNSGG